MASYLCLYDFEAGAPAELTFKKGDTLTLVEKKTGSKCRLEVTAGEFKDSEIVVMLGENGTGKTTFINHLLGRPGGKGYPGSNVGPEPTTDVFQAVMYGVLARRVG